MADQENFRDKIKALQDQRREDNGYYKRDVELSRFINVWKPLTDHILTLAEQNLPTDKRVRVEFNVDENGKLDLKFILETDKGTEDAQYMQYKDRVRWQQVKTLHFYNSHQGIVPDSVLGLQRLRDLFRRDNGNSHFALKIIDIGEPDKKLKGIAIHPDRMEKACDLLEYWLAKQIAFRFDPEMVNPKNRLEITIKRSSSGPEDGPV